MTVGDARKRLAEGDELAARRAKREKAGGNYQCPKCGGEWFSVKGLVLDQDWRVVGWSLPMECNECGKVVWADPTIDPLVDD